MQGIQTVLPVGSIIQNRYVVERLLGKGGFGAVYLVRDKRVKGNVFALKEIIDPEKKELENFAFEGGVLARLDHPALPRVYRTIEDDKNARAYLLMDYVEGPNLEVLRRKQPDRRFTVSRTLSILAPIVDAVEYLHRQHPPIIHRDIKPANIIVPESEDSSVLVDFGIAKEYDEDSTTTVVRRCSPGYAAPEQYARGTDARTDIYALAATCYALLMGQIPSDALHRMTSLGSQHMDPLLPARDIVPAVPQHISDAIDKAMSLNSDDRFASVEDFWQAMNALPVEEDVSTPVVELVQFSQQKRDVATRDTENVSSLDMRSHQRGKRRGALVLLLAAVAVVALLFGVVFGGNILTFASSSVHQSPTTSARKIPVVSAPTAQPTATAQLTATATSVPTAVPTPRPTVAATPTSVAVHYPTLSSNYASGTIIDRYTTPPTSSSMSLTQVRQQGANISGSFVVGPDLLGSGPFNGTVSSNQGIQFTVPATGGLLPLLFQGSVQANGSLSGTYCSFRNGQCDQTAGGYGDWHVAS